MVSTAAFVLIVWWSHGITLFAADDKLSCWEAENAIHSIGAPVKEMQCVPVKEV